MKDLKFSSLSRVDREIAENIVGAQYYSDSAKGIDYDTGSTSVFYPNRKHYDKKDAAILRALKLIAASKSSGFRFAVTYCDDFRNHAWIVYFNFKLNYPSPKGNGIPASPTTALAKM